MVKKASRKLLAGKGKVGQHKEVTSEMVCYYHLNSFSGIISGYFIMRVLEAKLKARQTSCWIICEVAYISPLCSPVFQVPFRV